MRSFADTLSFPFSSSTTLTSSALKLVRSSTTRLDWKPRLRLRVKEDEEEEASVVRPSTLCEFSDDSRWEGFPTLNGICSLVA